MKNHESDLQMVKDNKIMKVVNSISGGKTSSYMALHNQADYNIFSLVRIDATYCRPKDSSIVKYVSDKIAMDFIATAESDITLYAMRDLEQMLGKEIIWVTGKSFDEVCKIKKALPGSIMRFCTHEMKLVPIAEYWHKNIKEKVIMNIGYRYDEKERADKFNNDIKIVVGKHPDGRNMWKELDWRVPNFPLITSKIFNNHIHDWAKKSGIIFPPDSNCIGCFWKPYQQLRKNWEDEPNKMRWFSEMEKQYNKTFKKEFTFEQIKNIGLQTDFIFGTGSGCQAGFCTD